MTISAVRTALVPGAHDDSYVMLELTSGGRRRGLGAALGDEELLAELDHDVTQSLVGSDPTLIQAQLTRLSGSVSAEALSAVELALWDLLGHRAGLPMHQIWGAGSNRVRGMATVNAGPQTGDLVSRAERLVAAGFTAMSVELPGTGGAEVMASLRELRRTHGLSFDLAVSWSRPARSVNSDDLARLVDQLEELEVLWLDCSAQPAQRRLLETVRSRTRTLLIAAGAPDLPGLWELVRSECCDILRPHPRMVSMLELWKAAALAESASLGFLTPAASTALTQRAQLHLCLAAPTCDWLVVGLAQALPEGLDNDGCFVAPSDPGFGFRMSTSEFFGSGVPAAGW